jgi:antitoxin HigA-1
MPMKNPPHPGDLIKTEIIGALGLSASRAAEILKVRRATLSDLLRGKASLTPEIALRIEKAFGPDMDHLLRMQLAYDVAQTRRHSRGIAVKRYVPV